MQLHHDEIEKGINMEITLSAEQKALFDVMEKTPQHLFVTGRAGTGKSVLLRYFREHTRKKVAICAPTGIAALNVGGSTIHSLFKFPGKLQVSGELMPNKKLNSLLKRLDAIVIDEISMVRADLMDAIDERLRDASGKDVAFGGIQIIMYGDVYQLPPIVESGLAEYFEKTYGGYFFFNALAWQRGGEFGIYELTQAFRQKDPTFRNILNAVRDGTVVEKQIGLLNARHNVPIPGQGTVTLAATNSLVTNINQSRLDQLPGKAHHYRATVMGDMKKNVFPTEELLQLKKGAQVVLLKNDKDGRWVNGTLGVVDELFQDRINVRVNGIVYALERETWEEIVYSYDQATHKVEANVTSSFTQYPIRLAWAMTIHKSQGQTYESVALDLTTATFAPGQLYVALSRCMSLEGLYLKMPVERKHIIVEPRVAAFMARRETILAGEVVIEATISDQAEEIVADAVSQIYHDGIENVTILTAVVDKLRHDEFEQLDHDIIEKEDTQCSVIVMEKIEAGTTNSKREKRGRTRKERKSAAGAKTHGKEAKQPMQLSLDMRVIRTLKAWGVNASALYVELLSQHQPFLEKYREVTGEEYGAEDNEEDE